MAVDFRQFNQKLFAELTTVPDSLNVAYFPFLDGLRGISIIIVIASHFVQFTQYHKYIEGGIGVHIFFVLSGFLITTLILKEKINTGTVSLKKFYLRRVLRILPVVLLYLIVLRLVYYYYALEFPLSKLLTVVFFLKNFPLYKDWDTAHFWSLAVEEQFYIFFPLIIVHNINRYIKLALSLIVIMPIINYIGFHDIGIFGSNVIAHKAIFVIIHLFGLGTVSILIGSLCSILLFKRIIVVENLRSPYLLAFIVLLTAIIIKMKPVVDYAINLFEIVFPILISYAILLNLKGSGLLNSILNNKLLIRIGIISYSLYVWQQPFTNDMPWKYSFKYSDNILLNTLFIFVIATSSYFLFEKKILLYKNKFK